LESFAWAREFAGSSYLDVLNEQLSDASVPPAEKVAFLSTYSVLPKELIGRVGELPHPILLTLADLAVETGSAECIDEFLGALGCPEPRNWRHFEIKLQEWAMVARHQGPVPSEVVEKVVQTLARSTSIRRVILRLASLRQLDESYIDPWVPFILDAATDPIDPQLEAIGLASQLRGGLDSELQLAYIRALAKLDPGVASNALRIPAHITHTPETVSALVRYASTALSVLPLISHLAEAGCFETSSPHIDWATSLLDRGVAAGQAWLLLYQNGALVPHSRERNEDSWAVVGSLAMEARHQRQRGIVPSNPVRRLLSLSSNRTGLYNGEYDSPFTFCLQALHENRSVVGNMKVRLLSEVQHNPFSYIRNAAGRLLLDYDLSPNDLQALDGAPIDGAESPWLDLFSQQSNPPLRRIVDMRRSLYRGQVDMLSPIVSITGLSKLDHIATMNIITGASASKREALLRVVQEESLQAELAEVLDHALTDPDVEVRGLARTLLDE